MINDNTKRKIIDDTMSVSKLEYLLKHEKERQQKAWLKAELYSQSIREIKKRIDMLKGNMDYTPKNKTTCATEALKINEHTIKDILKIFNIKRTEELDINLFLDDFSSKLAEILNENEYNRFVTYLTRRSEGQTLKFIANELDISNGRLHQVVSNIRKKLRHPKTMLKFFSFRYSLVGHDEKDIL